MCTIYGELAEWSMALPWKGSIRESVSWVRIPCSPPFFSQCFNLKNFEIKMHLIKKIIKNFAGLIFGVIGIAGILIYFKIQETSYDSIMAWAEKQQKDHPEFVDFYGEMEPAFPEKTINSNTILGVDANKNGVRDDVDVWINRTASDKNETKAMRQYARAKQEWLNTCEKQNLKDVNAILLKLAKAKVCLGAVSDYQRLKANFAEDKLELLLLNNEKRLVCNEFYSRKGVFKVKPSDDVSNYYCDFEIQYLDNVILGNAEWKKSALKK